MKYKRLFKRWRDASGTRGYIDAVAGRRVSGWAYARCGVTVEALVGGVPVMMGDTGGLRPDVAAALGGDEGAILSGFMLDLSEIEVSENGVVDVTIAVRRNGARRPSKILGKVQIVGDAMARAAAAAPASGIMGPFPRGVIDIVDNLWPDVCQDLATSEGQAKFARQLAIILKTPDLCTAPEITRYVRYLSLTWAQCRFVEQYFPAVNKKSSDGRADFHCKPNSLRELFSIIHHLYVLKSYDVEGDFAEFGCFKGFSSSMLSYACRELGIRMHIFDSFEGLPPSEGSGYVAGSYAGSLEEVSDHIARFGAIDAVEFHRGFFEDTFRDYRPPRLSCLWMDVDLESSARDLMVVADKLEREGALFSHECTSSIFQDGKIVSERRRDNPVPPMLDRFDELGISLTGRFIAGNTGAFWPMDTGVPVLDSTILHRFIKEAL